MSLGAQIGRLAGLILVTVMALAVMLASGLGLGGGPDAPPTAEPTIAELPPAPVSIHMAQQQRIAITDTYSGMLKPWERYQLGFDIAGRVESLGQNADGEPLDDGDEIRQGQVLATLNKRHLEARVREAEAMLRKAQDEYDRAQQLAEVNPDAIRQTTLLTRETDLEVAKAQLDLAAKALEDATLTAEVDGVLARRMINPGEPAMPQQTAFEVVQVDRLLLSVGVPESRLPALVRRQAEVERLREIRPETTFRVDVRLSGRDAMGRGLPRVEGKVRTIAQTADEQSGLFEVEIELDNAGGELRPGQVGVASIVVAEVDGYRLPMSAAVVRDESRALFYAHDGSASDGPVVAAPPPEPGARMTARELPLREGDYVEQGSDLIVLNLPPAARQVITRGQHRLVSGSPIVAVQVDRAESEEAAEQRTADAQSPSARSSAAEAR